MTKRLLAVVVLIVAAAATTMCPSTKDECMSNYTLIDKDKAACLGAFSDLKAVIVPAPGPKIIIRKDVAALKWYVDAGGSEVLQATGGSAWASHHIRGDFVGTQILDFSVTSEEPRVYDPANYVVFATKLGPDTYFIEMIRTAGDKIRWFMSKNGNRVPLTQDSNLPPNEVPQEFTAPLVTIPSNSFREEVEAKTLDKVDFFRVAMP